MYLHEDRKLFKTVVDATADSFNLPVSVVEKDYYVTMILKLLSPHITYDEHMKALIKEVREHRLNIKNCLSAKPEISIPQILHKICDSDFFRKDYEEVTQFLCYTRWLMKKRFKNCERLQIVIIFDGCLRIISFRYRIHNFVIRV